MVSQDVSHKKSSIMQHHVPALFLLLFSVITAHAQGPSWQWAQAAGGGHSDSGQGICSDASGNLYVTGYFQSTGIEFGTFDLDNAQSNFTNDLFVVKYNAAGEVQWAQHAGGVDDQRGTAIATNAAGEVIVVGHFELSVTFGTTTLTSVGDGDVFLVTYDANGNVLWAQSFGGDDQDIPESVAVDASGNILVTGYFQGISMTVGSDVLLNAQDGTYDVFLARFSPTGAPLWGRRAGGSLDDHGRDVATDATGNVALVGNYESASITFGSTVLNNPNDNYNDLFLVKYDSNGNVLWGKDAGGILSESAFAVDASDNIFMAGHYIDATLNLDGTVLTNSTAVDFFDVFIAKYDPAGTLLWARSGGGASDDYADDLAIDGGGNAVLAGYSNSGTANFDTQSINGAGSFDLFAVKYDPTGTSLWARSAGGASSDRAFSVTTDAQGDVALTGYFNSDPLVVGATTLDHAGDNDLWVVKLGNTTGISEDEAGMTVTVHPTLGDGHLFITATDRISTIRVVDATGRVVHTASPASTTAVLNIPTSGTYVVQVAMGERVLARPILVQR